MTSHIVGVKDQVLVATITSKIGTSLFAKAEINSVEGLKGKTVATGRPAAFLDATVRYVLRSKFGLIPDRDVKLLPTGEPYLGLQALERGIVDAAAMSIPQLFIARKAGFKELVSFDKLGVEYPYTSVVVCGKQRPRARIWWSELSSVSSREFISSRPIKQSPWRR